jgi:hypothetical protein
MSRAWKINILTVFFLLVFFLFVNFLDLEDPLLVHLIVQLEFSGLTELLLAAGVLALVRLSASVDVHMVF